VIGAPRWALGPSLRLTLYAARFGSWTALRGYNVQTCESLGDVTFPAASPLPVGTPGTGFTLLYVQPLSPPRRNPCTNMPILTRTLSTHTQRPQTRKRARTHEAREAHPPTNTRTPRACVRVGCTLVAVLRVLRTAYVVCCMLHLACCTVLDRLRHTRMIRRTPAVRARMALCLSLRTGAACDVIPMRVATACRLLCAVLVCCLLPLASSPVLFLPLPAVLVCWPCRATGPA
jgi:hypothetical protein